MGNCFAEAQAQEAEINTIVWENATLSSERRLKDRKGTGCSYSTSADNPSFVIEEEKLRILLKSLCEFRQVLLQPTNVLDEEVELAVYDSKNLECSIRRLMQRISLSSSHTDDRENDETDLSEDELEVRTTEVRIAVLKWQQRVSALV